MLWKGHAFQKTAQAQVIAQGLTDALVQRGLNENNQAGIAADGGANVVKATSPWLNASAGEIIAAAGEQLWLSVV